MVIYLNHTCGSPDRDIIKKCFAAVDIWKTWNNNFWSSAKILEAPAADYSWNIQNSTCPKAFFACPKLMYWKNKSCQEVEDSMQFIWAGKTQKLTGAQVRFYYSIVQ